MALIPFGIFASVYRKLSHFASCSLKDCNATCHLVDVPTQKNVEVELPPNYRLKFPTYLILSLYKISSTQADQKMGCICAKNHYKQKYLWYKASIKSQITAY
ncbi:MULTISPECIES: hypothetical protein [Mangrovimonas]|uniref:hypothetical protein n=1 Tax=Mangrovimonas TaxID=1211036 RepID=UPI0006B5B263|nr:MULTISPECIES: hypothetical protein [Mangrovimonas]OMP32328.1 hypothetical protein BKM32_04565 [Mangrovimonas sp. DI 80]